MESTDDLDCICRGNWRKLVNEKEKLIGKQYKSEDGKVWTFFGLVHGDDDYYYGLCNKGTLTLLSCVADIEFYGFEMHHSWEALTK
jgi:hypothetical protein